jgi:DnaK suppressor protein
MAKAKRAKRPVKAATRKKAVKAKPAPKLKKLPRKVLSLYKKLLIEEREKVGGELSHITENTLNKSQRDLSGDLSGYSFHMADMASDDYERDFALGRATSEQGVLFAIDEALKRVEEGVYGLCQSCSKTISKQRLKAVPHAALCIECQKKNDMK